MSAKIKKTPNDRHDAAIAIAVDNLKRALNEEGIDDGYHSYYLVLILWMTGMSAEKIFAYIKTKIGECPIPLGRIKELINSFKKKLPKKGPEIS